MRSFRTIMKNSCRSEKYSDGGPGSSSASHSKIKVLKELESDKPGRKC